MLKIIGSFLIIICAGGFGFAFSNDYKTRLNELNDIKKIMIMLKGEIRFAKIPLGEAFSNISKRIDDKYYIFLENISDRLKKLNGESFYKIWEEEIDLNLTKLKLNSQDIINLKHFGENMGYLDNEMQIHSIDLYIEELEYEISKMTEQMATNTKVFKCLGIMAGMFVVIMLI